MLRKYLLLLLTIFIPSILSAIPAKRGIWQTVKLADGTTVRVELRGDEHAHWWQAEDGKQYVEADSIGSYRLMDNRTSNISSAKRRLAAKRMKTLMQKRRASGDKSIFQGEKKGLIILVDFPNKAFSEDNVQSLYNDIANKPGYNENYFNGSIRDYFITQSGGRFSLNFDVVGPVRMSHSYSYYGQNSEANAPEMVKEACEGVDSIVDFTQYDWDGDGEVEEVFVLYAGHGQADYDSNNDNLIWPHMYWLSAADIDLSLDGKKIDVYACSSELNSENNVAGIGTFCHEFSHCMGFPDIYDTATNPTNFGMGSWDLMDYGSYNDGGYTPAGYTGYERMVCGWTNPIELTQDTTITNIQPLIDNGQSYIVYNQGNRNEYYILTNRQQTGYDTFIPGHGMLIEHIDYDQDIWDANVVNNTSNTDYPNDHQRITVFHANNSESTYMSGGAAYPYNGNDSLTNNSVPAATVYNANSDGSHYMNCAISNITEDKDGTVNFSFRKEVSSDSDTTIIPKGNIIFKETFDKCDGIGGNDGRFSNISSRFANFNFIPDNDGWEGVYNYNLFGGDRCAWFGTSNSAGAVMTPTMTLPGDTVTLSFRAAGWNTRSEGTELEVRVSDNASLLDDGDLTLTKGEFQTYTLRLTGIGKTTLLFLGNKRFFLDDVMVTRDSVATSIKSVSAATGAKSVRIYTISGQYVGTDFNALPKGIYIVNGRKVVR